MKFILGFSNLVSNRFRSSMIKSRGGPPSLYCPLYTYLNVGTPRKPERTIGDLTELGYVQHEARKEKGDIVNYYHVFGTFNMPTSCQ